MIRFTSAKFQLNIHEVFILLGLKHLHHQSFEGGCCGEGHFFGDLLEGNENEQKKKRRVGGRKNTRKVTDKMESKRLHSAELRYSRAVPSPYVAKCVVKLTINTIYFGGGGCLSTHVIPSLIVGVSQAPGSLAQSLDPDSVLAADPAVLESVCQEGPRKEQCITPCWLCTVIPH